MPRPAPSCYAHGGRGGSAIDFTAQSPCPRWVAQQLPNPRPCVAELSLILFFALVALITAVALARWLSLQSTTASESHKLVAAVRRCSDEVLWSQSKRNLTVAFGLALGIAAAGLAASLLGTDGADSASMLYSSLWLAAGILLGCLVSVALGQLTLHVSTRTSVRVAATASSSSGAATTLALRGGGILGLAVEAAVLVVVLALIVLTKTASPAAGVALALQLLIGGLAVGVTLCALLSQIIGSAVHSAGQTGRREARFASTGRELDVRNPTLLLDVVGLHVGVAAVRAQDVLCASVLSHAACFAMASSLAGPDFDLAMVFGVPLVARATAGLGAAVALLTTRSSAEHRTAADLWRGALSAAVIAAVGLAGACLWLLGEQHWVIAFASGLMGLGCSLLLTISLRSRRREHPLGQTAPSPPDCASLGVFSGLSGGLRGSCGPLAVLSACVAVSWLAASGGDTAHGGGLLLLMAWTGFSLTLPYFCALTLFEPITETGCGLSSLDPTKTLDQRRRAAALGSTGRLVGAQAQRYLVTASGFLGLLVALALPGYLEVTDVESSVLPQATLTAGPVFFGLLGSTLILCYCAFSLRHVAGTVRRAATELGRQLQAFSTDAGGRIQLPSDFRPRYAEYLQLATQQAFRHARGLVLGTLIAVPALVGVLQLGLETEASELASWLVWLLVFSTLTGTCIACIGVAASAFINTRSDKASETNSPAWTTAVVLSVADFAANAVSPAAHLIAKGVAATCLALIPLLT